MVEVKHTGPQRVASCLLEGWAEPAVDREEEAGRGWDTLGPGGALPRC